jgi:flagellar biosynthetic protein FlhB
VAKGVDYLALRIKEMAREHRIMLVENRFLARELYGQVKEGEEIPEALYAAVAEVLAYVYSIKGKI